MNFEKTLLIIKTFLLPSLEDSNRVKKWREFGLVLRQVGDPSVPGSEVEWTHLPLFYFLVYPGPITSQSHYLSSPLRTLMAIFLMKLILDFLFITLWWEELVNLFPLIWFEQHRYSK